MTSFLKKEWKFITIIIMVFLVFAISMILIFTLNGNEKYKEKVDNDIYKFKTTLIVDYDNHKANMKVKNQSGAPLAFGDDSNTSQDQIGGGEKYESGWTNESYINIFGKDVSNPGVEKNNWYWDINYGREFATFEEGISPSH